MRELFNKLRVYRLVSAVDRHLGLSPGHRRSLGELVEQAYARGDYPALWLIEGLGLRVAQLDAARGLRLDLSTPDSQLPRESLAMLHAGLGLALATEQAESLGREPSPVEINAGLDHFEAEARARSQPGYLGAVLESLGLVVRVFHDHLRAAIGERVATRPALRDCFWHGVGRGSYFTPRHFGPGLSAPWSALTREAPDERARFNMRAGLGWAIAMVNIEHPRLAARVLARLDEDTREAAVAGMCSALMIRAATTPGPLARQWPEAIAARCASAIDEELPALLARGELGRAFSHSPALLAREAIDSEKG